MTKPIRKLAIVGASARAAAFSAIRAGYEVVAADLFADADLQRVAAVTRIDDYPEGLADWLAATECDAWLYTGALENHPDLVDRMAAIRPLLGNGGDALRRVRDPLQLQAALAEAGVRFPETRAFADGLPLDGSWLCKTYRGASGSGVWRLDGKAALDRAIAERAVFQQFVPGEPAAVVLVTSTGSVIPLGVTRQLLGGNGRDWQYVGSIGPYADAWQVAQPVAWMKWLLAVSEVLSERFGLRGLMGVDLVLSDDGPWVIEVNPRYTASIEIVERFAFIPVIAAHVAACTESEAALPRLATSLRGVFAPGAMQYAKSILYASREVQISAGVFDWLMGQAVIDPLRCRLADIPQDGEIIPEGRPVLTAFASGSTFAECEANLRQRLAEVRARLYDG